MSYKKLNTLLLAALTLIMCAGVTLLKIPAYQLQLHLMMHEIPSWKAAHILKILTLLKQPIYLTRQLN